MWGESPCVWRTSGRSSHGPGCGFDEPSKSFQHFGSVVKIRQTHVATNETEEGSYGTLSVV